MKEQLFNSTFELELRVLLLLQSVKKQSMSVERIIFMDFIVCYAGDFQMPFINLHGDNQYMYGELASRRKRIQEAMKRLVIHGLVDVSVDRGYYFTIADAGKQFVRKLKSEYACRYREIAASAVKLFGKNTDAELEQIIQDNALKTVRGEL